MLNILYIAHYSLPDLYHFNRPRTGRHDPSNGGTMPQLDIETAIKTLGPTRATVKRLSDAQRSLQKFNATIRVATGSSASNPLRGQGRVLALLAEHDEMRQRDMCDALRVRPQSLGEMLVKLENAGLVTRHSVEPGAHALVVRITDKGRHLIEHRPYLREFKTFTEDELIQFMEYLDRFSAEIDEQRLDIIERQKEGGAE